MSDTDKSMQFLFGDRELILKIEDLLSAPVDVIVNAANGSLSHGGGIAAQVVQQGGSIIQDESDQFIKEHGKLESGMVAYTTAGRLPYAAVIHAVGPVMGEGHEQHKIEQAVSRSLMLCSMHDWNAIAFPAISSGIFRVPIEIVAKGFYRAITSFWDARMDIPPQKIIICLTKNNFQPFFTAFQQASKPASEEYGEELMPKSSIPQATEKAAGIVNLNEEDLAVLEDDEVNDWFK